ncbi:2-oxo acid dehydrogenase subunit E2 [Virgibacillus halodenitrificans]|uniref:Dihydrolipoamide acetyltransferase component of pyruvate dehydrogenase complex n=1 Tax=Virgibacillus halodenitrificans TaxID=1482 RepID=A0AAC9NL68_VIRHA|nr:dihydrolipoamide acetyltransferase family protein [Virgibacillus halodenitrificans]APC48356.1 branched-chain alpha-keto acid dehydrogenase subunit E2 [Virgibacillus halodenitrificans]MCG1029862.1 2-oxo acid dehydrogenase subunit E2 [Virgibacillus halodenitrificans]MEC2158375.1 dihydrolipoamide acetyltransferase family protein [Virgibacillus halodenitrificans]MYL46920.1 2-oxo acid dehydrogenase subunit E2 [Virgibacillus halodenitrificans]WHX27436.1 dihydrolipoamide acetyltransferase family p
MAQEKINMPQLGESVTEGTISSWLVAPGDKVNKYDPIAEVMTDKVNAEVPSSFTGTIKELVADEGQTIEVGELMCYIDTEESQSGAANEETSEKTDYEASEEVKSETDTSMKKRYSPAVLRMAQENDIDLSQIEGSGRQGRITRKDIEKIIKSGNVPQESTTSSEVTVNQSKTEPSKMKSEQNQSVSSSAGDIEIPVTGVRKVIAQNMVRSKQEIPHAWMTVEVDVTDLVTYRNKVKNDFKQKEGFSLTFFAFFVKAVAQALKEYPQLNSTWAEDKIIQRKDINLSIAVAKDQELFVPVIKHADEKSIKGIARDIYELAMKARSNKLTSSDMQGGTFTVNNTGSFGSIHSMGVINHPQAAILQVESIVKRPVIVNDMFAARDMVNLSLSLDHRILDGLVCGQFLARVKEILENMNSSTSLY